MSGYDAGFLPVRIDVPAPAAPEPIEALEYVHFSVLHRTERRLARVTAVNIDGERLVDLGRGDDWHLDSRLAAGEQAGPEIYSRNDFDRGHLVRRRDPVWGDAEVAKVANYDTFSYTNAAPQVNTFNQSKDLWLGLETLIIDYAEVNDLRLSVFTGPVFADDDPEYRGLLVPRRFWKVAVWSPDGSTLASAAFLLDQTTLVENLIRRGATAGVAPLGEFRTFGLPVSELADITGLVLDPLIATDVRPARRGVSPSPWQELVSPADVAALLRP